MPIYEFKCLKCGELVEMLFKSSSETVEMKCAACGSPDMERVMSATNFSISGGSGSPKPASQTRTCGSGSCTTYEIPGHSR
ncbi:MAG: zinc ribbon domain-containing protein [Desulfobacterales bacterium]|nr:zinc ribbon domain-containing protein [Desulfobacterales bacterium]